MMEGETSDEGKKTSSTDHFIDSLFSLSLEDISNEYLYTDKGTAIMRTFCSPIPSDHEFQHDQVEKIVEKIPDTFQSVQQYLGSYVYPLLEETRAQLFSSMEILYRAPFAEVVAFDESKPYGTKVYQVSVDYWRNRFNDRSKEPYKTLPGDILLLANAKPETFSDLERTGRSWSFLSVTKITEDDNEDDSSSTYFKVMASKDFELEIEKHTSLFVIFLANVTSHKRIWKALHMSRNLKFLDDALCTGYRLEKKSCDSCFEESNNMIVKKLVASSSSNLNKSQLDAILSCLHMLHCKEKSAFQLIWGPPGTGKTKTTATLLVAFLKMKYRTVICAPTNVAITEVASRVLKMIIDAEVDGLFHSSGDILLFGNKERLKVGLDIQEIYLDHRVQRLAECVGPLGWNHSFTSMINFLEDCVLQYRVFQENELRKLGEQISDDIGENGSKKKVKSFLEYVRERYLFIVETLKKYIYILCTHIPKSYILDQNFQNMIYLVQSLDCFECYLFQDNVVSEELEALFSCSEVPEDLPDSFKDKPSLLSVRSTCISVLRTLLGSLKGLDLPSFRSEEKLMQFCFQRASLVFCTASSSYKLHRMKIEPLTILVIDEAAQLKECESTIPLQLPGIRHAILVGDECQLPATVTSKVSAEAGFGRSLFERLSLLNHSKCLLNVQYRMHPSISLFPNSRFYHNQIQDAPIVKRRSYEKHYLSGSMFGSYSFLNVIGGREEKDDDGRSRKNMVEVAIVFKTLEKLYKAWIDSQSELSIGIVSPYSAQVIAIQDKLGNKYENIDGFQVKVKTVDGFQGGEEDIIIISTVKANASQLLDFISKPQRMNVALTRARHCLWILGNERTLASGQSIWGALIDDAKNRSCFFNVDDDKDLAKVIIQVKKELDQFDDLLNADSTLFRSSKWKVLFSDNFLKSFKKLVSVRMKKSVLNLLLKVASGWRPKRPIVASGGGSSLEILKFKVEGLYVVSTVDIVKVLKYTQVLKIWDVLPPDDIPKLIRRLDSIFAKYTDEFINLCNEKSLEGNLVIPKSWPPSFEFIQRKDLTVDETGSDLASIDSDGRSYVENSKVSESLLLMKFYSLSYGVVNHLLSDRDGRELDLPFEVTDQEMEIILFPRSSFILGRSGTGKTTVLTMKLFKREQFHHMATVGSYGANNNELGYVDQKSSAEDKPNVLRQLFVTVSPKLCNAIKQHVSNLASFACGGSKGSSSTNVNAIDDEEAQFENIPDSFIDIGPNSYPLVITFHKFLMMLDGTLSRSYFERFLDVKILSHGQRRSSRSVAFQTFLGTKEVNYEKFCVSYWPHFSGKLTKKLDPSRVFTEIISSIKGGTQALEASGFKLSRNDYVKLSGGRSSSLSGEIREIIYDIFQMYENMKAENGEFDLADFVIDLHYRLRHEKYVGDRMDFVYIDEVQDLTMSQIALFKHICSNYAEGFVFSGDTAQTIARGIDFRFQDIRSLFYKRFLLESKSQHEERREKGKISGIFSLSQNFRTHAGILKLSQSIIELLYHFFPQSIDILEPENSLIYGEAPVLLLPGSDENAIVKIFGNTAKSSGNFVGFGAEQVILVRNDKARNEIAGFVGKQALLLTILECKGLEFQDVLLYNFFGSSPLRNQWRVIYEYMKAVNLFDSSSPNCPKFSESKHNILCSELKQLYVAVTRTRQRLWICENTEISKPMFDYWKKKCLVQVRQLDDSLAQAMQVTSSPEEWRSRGIKLFHEKNYEWATVCFERAEDKYWERMSKASGLKAMADNMRTSKPEEANSILREAAEIFEAIGRVDLSARCFVDLGEYEKAGRIYLEKFGESELGRAAECFSLAGCYELAANVYAKGNFFSECLTICSRGKLFDRGLEYIQYWKQNAKMECGRAARGIEIEEMAQKFLEKWGFHYHEIKDERSMMKFVRAFDSMSSIRNFLRQLKCFNELMLLEEESGNFVEAAELAKQKGDTLLTADLLGKVKKYKEAASIILLYVLANSLWSSGGKGWPLKQFKKKDELLEKAKSFAKNDTDNFYELVCTEAAVMSNEQSDLAVMMNQLIASQKQKSVRGEILSARKILEAHISSVLPTYFWEEELVFNLIKHSEDLISENKLSVESLVYFWNIWKDKIASVFESLGHLGTSGVNEFRSYAECCLNFLGVWRPYHNLSPIYILLTPEADWARNVEKRSLWSFGMSISVNVHQLVSAAHMYWSSEVLSVGIKVLGKLEALYDFQIQSRDSLFCKSRILTLIYEVANFLLNSTYLKRSNHCSETLSKFIRFATDYFVCCIFPSDWRKSPRLNMILLRGTAISKSLLTRVILESISFRNMLSYGQIGKIVMIILGSGNIDAEHFEKIVEGLEWNPPWRAFLRNLYSDGLVSCNVAEESGRVESHEVSEPRFTSEETREAQLIWSFREALSDAFNSNWLRVDDYISPHCLLYLVEHLLSRAASIQGYVITTRSLFSEWLMFQEEYIKTKSSYKMVAVLQESLERVREFVIHVVKQCLYNSKDMIEWIQRSSASVNKQFSLLVSRLIVIICLLEANFGRCRGLVFHLLGRKDIADQLPREFLDTIMRGKKRHFPSVLAESLKKVDDPLVIVSLWENCREFSCPDAMFMDMKVNRCKNDVLRTLFPRTVDCSAKSLKGSVPGEVVGSVGNVLPTINSTMAKSSDILHSNVELVANQDSNVGKRNECSLPTNFDCFWEILEDICTLEDQGKQGPFFSTVQTIKGKLVNYTHLLTAAMATEDQNSRINDTEHTNPFLEMVDELNQLCAALDVSEEELPDKVFSVKELSHRLQSRWPRMESLLNQLFCQHGKMIADDVAINTHISSGDQGHQQDSSSPADKNDDSENRKPKASEADVNSGTPSGSGKNTESKGKGNGQGKGEGKGKGKPSKSKKKKGGK